MKLVEYQDLALRSCKMGELHFNLDHAALGICTESAEIADAYKRFLVYGKPLDQVNLIEEVGDNLWYCALLAHTIHSPLGAWEDAMIVHLLTQFEKVKNNPGQALSVTRALQSSAGRLIDAVDDYVGSGHRRGASATFERYMDIHLGLLAQFAFLHGFTLGQAAEANIRKLRIRFPDGFAQDRALGRDLAAERAALETSGNDSDNGSSGAPATVVLLRPASLKPQPQTDLSGRN